MSATPGTAGSGVSAMYQSAEIGRDRFVTVDHVFPGQVLTFDHTGKVFWRYAPTGDRYGHTKVAGSTPGLLNNPTGMDLYPPNAIAAKFPAK